MDVALFLITATIAVAAAILVVAQRNPMHSALYLIITFLCLAVLYVQLHAQFLAVMQVLVYAGAIMVLFLFVVMLLHQDRPLETLSQLPRQNALAAVFSLVLFLELIYMGVQHTRMMPVSIAQTLSESLGTVETVAWALFTRYLLPFELASVILLVGMVGAVVLAKRKV